MSAMKSNDLSAKIRSARIEGALLRSKQDGKKEGKIEGKIEGEKEGFKKAEEMFVKKLLKTNTPQEIFQKLDIPIERIKEIKNDN